MTPFLLYPQNAEQAKFFSENAEKQGVGFVPISKELLDKIDEMMFAEELVKIRRNAKLVPIEKVKKLIAKKLAE